MQRFSRFAHLVLSHKKVTHTVDRQHSRVHSLSALLQSLTLYCIKSEYGTLSVVYATIRFRRREDPRGPLPRTMRYSALARSKRAMREPTHDGNDPGIVLAILRHRAAADLLLPKAEPLAP
jgi:hypothetical protein